MEFKIANKDYTLHFGWDFLEQINALFGMKIEADGGVEINTRSNGYPFMIQGLESRDPVALQYVIQAATATEKSKPSKVNIRKAILELMQEDIELYKMTVDEILDEIKKDEVLQVIQRLVQD